MSRLGYIRSLGKGEPMKVGTACAALVVSGALLTGCGGGNPAAAANEALVEFAQDMNQLSALDVSNASPATITPVVVDQWAADLDAARSSFMVLESELATVEFPQEFTTRGQPAQSTVDEYLISTDQYLTVNEQAIDRIQQCIETGGSAYDCTMNIGAELLLGVYPEVLQRSQEAALQLTSEMSRA